MSKKFNYQDETKNQEKVTVEEVTAPVTIKVSYVKLQSQLDARLLYTGQVTGKSYEWTRAGSVVEVDALDAPYLLSKRTKKQSCCSGSDIAVFKKLD